MRSTVSAVKMHTLSAVIRINKLVFSIVLRLGCLCSDGNLRNPNTKFLKVVGRLEISPLLEFCSNTEQQLHIPWFDEPISYLPKIVINVVKPARVYPIV
jgi:hypothetical protein